MILIGQYDSPFVRRVGIALTLYGLAFEHKPWSTFADADQVRAYNPLVRVPTLALDDGVVLTDSHCILDYLDNLVASDLAMVPRTEPARHRAIRISALATGLADKAVSLFYEQRLHSHVSDTWVTRCQSQITATLALLETERAQRASPYWFGDRIGHADVAVACAWRFLGEAHPPLLSSAQCPALTRHCAALESLPVFQSVAQPFIPPS